MLDFIFDSFFAFQSLFMMMGAFLCVAIGALILQDFIMWQLKAKRLTGRIVSFKSRANNEQTFYYPVAEYTDRDGNLQQVTSESGYSQINETQIGKRITLLHRPDQSKSVRFSGSGSVIAFIGIIFLGVGLFLLKIGIQTFEGNYPTILVGLLLAFWLILKLKKTIKPRDQWESVESFRHRMKVKRLEKEDKEYTSLSITDIKQLAKKQRLQTARWSWIPMVMGCIFLGISAYTGQETFEFETKGRSASGYVVAVEARLDTNGTTYFKPIVEYTDLKAQKHKFKSDFGSNPSLYEPYDQVNVLYMPDDPSHKAMIDNGLWNWLFPGIFAAIGLFMILIIFPKMNGMGTRRK